MEVHLSCGVMVSMGWRLAMGAGLPSFGVTKDDGLLLVRQLIPHFSCLRVKCLPMLMGCVDQSMHSLMQVGFDDGDGGANFVGLPVQVLKVMAVDFAVSVIRINLM